jgi:hypothetical protein
LKEPQAIDLLPFAPEFLAVAEDAAGFAPDLRPFFAVSCVLTARLIILLLRLKTSLSILTDFDAR